MQALSIKNNKLEKFPLYEKLSFVPIILASSPPSKEEKVLS